MWLLFIRRCYTGLNILTLYRFILLITQSVFMEIKKLMLQNLGRFDQLEVDFAPTKENKSNVTVFIGNNGAGKTSILEALATSLSWFVARVRSEKGTGTAINEFAIINGAPAANITLQLCDDTLSRGVLDNEIQSYKWSLTKARKGHKSDKPSYLSELTKLADVYRQLLTNDSRASLPFIAYYPVERSVLDIPLKIRGKHSFTQIEGYDSALIRGVDFRRFFEWFREREDIENQEENILYEDFFSEEEVLNSFSREKKELKNVSSEFKIVENYYQEVRNQFVKISALEEEMNDNTFVYEIITKELESIKKEYELIKNKLNNINFKKPNITYKDKQLDAVRTAITDFMPELSNIRVQRKPYLHMSVEKNGKSLNVMQLSQGEKSLMALVGDIARRLAMMNPSLENPLDGDGIILIDELDMHLHPSWQRNLVHRFTETFKNCQIILTTHSPLVISDQRDILVYLLKDGEIDSLPPLFGKDVNTVLLEAMDTNIRDPEIDRKLRDLADLIQNNKLNEAKKLYEQLYNLLPENNIELAKANLIIRKKELRNEKN